MGMDTHALSEPALASALEVFAAAGITVMIPKGLGYTPTPVISHAILTHNQNRLRGFADGVVITPSHNPPEDGGRAMAVRSRSLFDRPRWFLHIRKMRITL